MSKILQGKIVSAKMQKTAVVSVQRVYRHPIYKKIIKKHKKYKAHNEMLSLKIGDMVEIKETSPISSQKRFVIIKKITK